MPRRIGEWIIMAAIAAGVLLLAVFVLDQQDRGLLSASNGTPEFSRTDLQYMQTHDTIRIYVEDGLQYLIGGEEGGYLQDYLTQALAPAHLRPVFVTTEEEAADGSLQVITAGLRQSVQGRSYTAPLFQMEGAMFLRSAADAPLSTVLQQYRLSDSEAAGLSYQDRPLQYTTAPTAAAAVAQAQETDAAAIIGDRSSVRDALAQAGLAGAYQPLEKEIYSCNACILVDSSQAAVYDILSECIYNADRHNISYEASEKWLNGEGPVFLRQDYRSSYLPVLIMILSVLVAFFVYYLSNRSMYQELNARMDQITERRNELQTTFHGVGHLMAELTPAGMITDLNRAFAESLDTGALHRPLWEVLDLEAADRTALQKMVEQGAAGVQPSRFETKVGNRIFVVDIFPVEDARGAVAQLIFIAVDVTQERMTKRQMLQDNKMIAIGQLAAGVAHEIRNPLGIIRNYCYVLKTMEDEEIRARAIAEIERAVETSGGIINNLLDFSRVSPGRMEQIDVEDHVRALLVLNEMSFREKNIELVIESPVPIRTYMAMEPFDMILMNLVKNAVDAIADSGRITIRIQRLDGRFRIEVEDTGEGIDEAALEEIFNPFYTTKGNLGTGLGLYIVYSEVEKLDGEIDVSSVRGEGTSFRVTLPLRSEPPAQTVNEGAEKL